jgi:hypothetical protein
MENRMRWFLLFFTLGAMFAVHATAQISTLTGASPWPVYVYDTETLPKRSVILSGIGGTGFLADGTKSYSAYSGLDLGVTDRFLVSVAVSGSTDDSKSWDIDDTVVHAKYKVVDRDRFDFAIAGNLERLPLMKDAGYSAFDGQVFAAAQASVGSFAAYGQVGFSSRKQVFEGGGARYDFFGRAIISGNFSYRHDGDFYRGKAVEEISAVRATAYATIYVPVSSRVGLTGSVGRTLVPINPTDPSITFCTFGLGVRLH